MMSSFKKIIIIRGNNCLQQSLLQVLLLDAFSSPAQLYSDFHILWVFFIGEEIMEAPPPFLFLSPSPPSTFVPKSGFVYKRG